MPSFIASYDLKETTPSPHVSFLDQATKHGWKLWILSSKNIWFRLPNTTLEGSFATKADAVAALKNARAATEAELGRPVTLLKWIVVDFSAASLDSDVSQPV
ncbi:MAG: hypothetical protein JSS22_09690 [Proteobacteria bacterium]|nr:hypothetical protein [Pseudomonadota bacterium]